MAAVDTGATENTKETENFQERIMVGGPRQVTVVRGHAVTHRPVQVVVTPKLKNLADAYVLAIAFGFFGAHHFYLGRGSFGALYFFTFGLLGIGYLVDLCRIPTLVEATNWRLKHPATPRYKLLSDAYLLWIPPFGLLGFHNIYLRRYGWAVAYMFTLGFLGLGWLVDGFLMKRRVEDLNQRLEGTEDLALRPKKDRSVCTAYILTLFPLTGILGIQHYYMGRFGFGVLYTCTLGLLGVGWLVDCFRMSCLVHDVNQRAREGSDGTVRLDDCYVLWFPLGILGLHHFYLARYCWGILYLCTLGGFLIGWLIDLFRLPWLVSSYNDRMSNNRVLVNNVRRQYGDNTTVIVTDSGSGGQLYPDLPPPYPGPQRAHMPATFVYPPPGMYPPQGYMSEGYPFQGNYGTMGHSAVYPPGGASHQPVAPHGPPPYEEIPEHATEDSEKK